MSKDDKNHILEILKNTCLEVVNVLQCEDVDENSIILENEYNILGDKSMQVVVSLEVKKIPTVNLRKRINDQY